MPELIFWKQNLSIKQIIKKYDTAIKEKRLYRLIRKLKIQIISKNLLPDWLNIYQKPVGHFLCLKDFIYFGWQINKNVLYYNIVDISE